MRRSPEEGERLLAEALDRLHASQETHDRLRIPQQGRTGGAADNRRR
jgi:hypothetical protein